MPKVVVAEPDPGPPDGLSCAECACELLAVAEEDDLVLIPHAVGDAYLGYLGGLLGRRLGRDNVIVADHAVDDGRAAAEIRVRAGDLTGWRLIAYRAGPAVVALADDLGLPLCGPDGDVGAETREFHRFGGAEAFHGRMGLYLLAGTVDAPVAPGRLAGTEHTLAQAVRTLLPAVGRVLIRQRSGRGDSLVVTVHDEIRDESGPVVRVPDDDCDFDFLAAELWPLLSDHRGTPVLIEVHHHVTRSYVAEFWVSGRAQPPRLLAIAERRDGVRGFWLHGGRPDASALAEATAHSVHLAAEVGRRGYGGILQVESVLTGEGALLIREVRAATGSCVPAGYLARALAGPGCDRDRSLLTRTGMGVRDFPTAVEAVEAAGVAYDRLARTGVAVTVDATACHSQVGWLVVGLDAAHADNLEQRALAALRRTWNCLE